VKNLWLEIVEFGGVLKVGRLGFDGVFRKKFDRRGKLCWLNEEEERNFLVSFVCKWVGTAVSPQERVVPIIIYTYIIQLHILGNNTSRFKIVTKIISFD